MSGTDPAAGRRSLSVRWRLTLTYSVLFAACGLVLLTLVYLLVLQSQQPQLTSVTSDEGPPPVGTDQPGPSLDEQLEPREVVHDVLAELLRWSLVALLGMVGISVLVGWFIAGRALAPVHAITSRAQGISADDLDERIALEGRADELKEMADTFDGLLDRVQGSVESEKRLVATLSHELRTPLANQQVALEVALERAPDAQGLRHAAQVALDQSRRATRTIEALLDLARAQQERRAPAEPMAEVDLTGVVQRAVADSRDPDDGLDWSVELAERVQVPGEEVLLHRAAANLVENAVGHNHAGGWVAVRLVRRDGLVELRVTNSGAVIAAEDAATLTLPFRRAAADRVGSGGSIGLGLSIVEAIAEHHRARFEIVARADGGLDARLSLPR